MLKGAFMSNLIRSLHHLWCPSERQAWSYVYCKTTSDSMCWFCTTAVLNAASFHNLLCRKDPVAVKFKANPSIIFMSLLLEGKHTIKMAATHKVNITKKALYRNRLRIMVTLMCCFCYPPPLLKNGSDWKRDYDVQKNETVQILRPHQRKWNWDRGKGDTCVSMEEDTQQDPQLSADWCRTKRWVRGEVWG